MPTKADRIRERIGSFRGATILTIKAHTNADLKKTGNPIKETVWKTNIVNGMINFQKPGRLPQGRKLARTRPG